jgi:hypothetical protein
VLEQWDRTGRKLDELRRNAGWFPSHGRSGLRSESEPPNPSIFSLWIDRDGRAWVLIAVPGAEWQSAIFRRGVLHGRTVYGVSDYNTYYDTLLEVIDIESAAVIARGRLTARPWNASGDGLILTFTDSEAGAFVEVWRPRIVHGPRR